MVRVSNFSDTDPSGGGLIDADCLCHFEVEEVQVDEHTGKVVVVNKVLASSSDEQVGKRHSEFFYFLGKPGAVKRLLQWCCAVGVYSTERWKADKEAGVDPDLEFSDGEGRQWCGEIKMEDYGGDDPEKKGRKYPQVAFRIHAVGDDRAVRCPKDPGALQLFARTGLPCSDGRYRAAKSAPPIATQQTQAQPAAPRPAPVAPPSSTAPPDEIDALF